MPSGLNKHQKAGKMAQFFQVSGVSINVWSEGTSECMHGMVCHLPRSLQLYGGLWKFSGQVEKMNDVLKTIYHRQSTRWDSTKEALIMWNRLCILQDFQRECLDGILKGTRNGGPQISTLRGRNKNRSY